MNLVNRLFNHMGIEMNPFAAETAKKAVHKYGNNYQVDIAIEECSELIEALCHHRRNKVSPEKVCEEIADVALALESLKHIFSEFVIKYYYDIKIERLNQNIEKNGLV